MGAARRSGHPSPLPMHRLFTFDTTHHALWAEVVAGAAGIPAGVVPAPPGAHARCNLALETFPEELPRLAAALDAAGVPYTLHPPVS